MIFGAIMPKKEVNFDIFDRLVHVYEGLVFVHL